MPARGPRWGWRETALAGLLVAAILLAYGAVGTFEFVNYDDNALIIENAHLRAGLSESGLLWGLTTFEWNWHPLTWWSFLLDFELYGLNPAGYHIENLLWHIASTLVCFAALRRLTGEVWPSALAAALFALHPLNVQSVAWVSERKGVMSTFFAMLTLWAYARYVERPSAWRYAAVFTALTLGLMCKQMLVTLPCVLLLLDCWPLGRCDRRIPESSPRDQNMAQRGLGALIVEKLPLLAVCAVASVLACLAQSDQGITSLEAISLAARLKNSAISYVAYLGQAVWPAGLAVLYPHRGDSLTWTSAAGALALLLALTALVLGLRRRMPYLAVGWFWYLGTLVPVIGLVQLGMQARADRYAYLPLLGLFIAFSWTLAAGARRFHLVRPVAALASLVVGCLTITTWAQTQTWQNSVVLWEHAIRVTGGNLQMHNALGLALIQADKEAALAEFLAALRCQPEDAMAHHNAGVCLLEQGDYARAAEHLQAALRSAPHLTVSRYHLGVCFMHQGASAQAVPQFAEVLRSHGPADLAAGAQAQLGICLQQARARGDRQLAIEIEDLLRAFEEPRAP